MEEVMEPQAENVFDEAATPAGRLELPPDLTREEAAEKIREYVEGMGGDPEAVDPSAIDEMTAEQAEAIAGPVEMQMPMLQIPLDNVNVNIIPGPDGAKGMIVGPVAISFLLPFSAEGAKHVARNLTGGIEIAHIIPPNLKAVES